MFGSKSELRKIVFPLMAIFFLVLLAFYPLFMGKHFLPFATYKPYSYISEKTSGCQIEKDKLFDAVKSTREYGVREIDYSGISILYAMETFIAQNIRKGVLPLWDPYIGCGVPTFGEGQFKPFNPFFIPFIFFQNANIYSFCIFFELLLGFWFMVVFLKDLKNSTPSAVLGGALFILNPYVLNRISFSDHIQAFICLPIILYFFNKAENFDIFTFFKIALSLILLGHIGHPEMSVIVTLISVIYFLLFNKKPLIKKILFISLLGFFIFFSLAVYIFPLIENYLKGVSYKNGVSAIYVHTNLKHLFIPSADMNILPFIFLLIFLGFLNFNKKKLFFACLMFFSLLYSVKIPFIGSLLTKSGFTLFIPCYFKLIFWFAGSVLASFGLDSFVERKKWKSEISVFLLAFLLMAYMPSFLAFPLKDVFKGLNLFYIFSFIPISFIIVKIFKDEKIDLKKNEIMSFILFLTIFPYAFPLSNNLIKWNNCDIKDYDSVKYVKSEFPHSRIASLSLGGMNCFPPNYGSSLSLRQVEINTFIFPNSFYLVLKRYSPFPTIILFNKIDELLLKKIGADFVFVPNSIPNFYEKEIFFKGNFSSVYKIGDGNGRAFLAEAALPLNSLNDFSYEKLVSLPPNEVYIEGCDKTEPTKLGKYSIDFLEDNIHKVSLNVKTDKRAILVLRDTYDKDWKVYVDGVPAKSYRIDGLFRGAEIPEGGHSVVWIYKPNLFYISLFVSVCFHLILAIFFVLFYIKKIRIKRKL